MMIDEKIEGRIFTVLGRKKSILAKKRGKGFNILENIGFF